eukprot:maker-scaffold247_size239117-snap-gene-1.26 protein:Tk09338 transcript:maker-scaffold247_size239117-snap-gene-1.26-mRNA-1 annotation:"PREDICTED: uncharacterized protein LOC103514474"
MFNWHNSLIWIFPLLSLTSASSCPRKCECIWRDAKITVDCSDQGLGSVPTDVDGSTQMLNISGNHIPLLGGRQFSRFGLTNLQRISAMACGLAQIDAHAFQGLTNLVELNLAQNNLPEVPHEALAGDVPSLMTLNLRHNSISRIPSKAFHQLSYLHKLDLSENKIQVVESGAFQGLRSLQRVYLHANRISTLDAQDIPPSLHGITLHDNRWSCDCHQRGFRLWLTQSNVPRPMEPVCHGPRRLLGIRIPSLSLAEFACAPQLSPTSMYLTVAKGKNVSIVCRVSSDPLSEITWFFNGQKIKDVTTTSSPDEGTNRKPQEDNHSWSHRASASIQSWEQPNHHGYMKRIFRHDVIISETETRSELLLHNTSLQDNGTYHCQAENKAARSVSNFTLHIADHVVTPKILQLRLEYFVAVAVGVILILVLIIMAVAVLLIRLCRKRIKSKPGLQAKASSFGPEVVERSGSSSALYPGSSKKVAPVPAKMPKHIRMGTGYLMSSGPGPTTSISASSQLSLNPYLNSTTSDRPDLLTDHSASSSGKGSSAPHRPPNGGHTTSSESSGQTSTAGGSHPASQAGSYRLAMENIIDDYRLSNPRVLSSRSNAPPLIGAGHGGGNSGRFSTTNRPLSSVMSDCLRGSGTHLPDSCISKSSRDLLGLDAQASGTLYPSDYGLPRSALAQDHSHVPVGPSSLSHATGTNLRAFANPNYGHYASTLPHHYHSYQAHPDPAQLGPTSMTTLMMMRFPNQAALRGGGLSFDPSSHYMRAPPMDTATTLDALTLWQYQQFQEIHPPTSLHPNTLGYPRMAMLPDEQYPEHPGGRQTSALKTAIRPEPRPLPPALPGPSSGKELGPVIGPGYPASHASGRPISLEVPLEETLGNSLVIPKANHSPANQELANTSQRHFHPFSSLDPQTGKQELPYTIHYQPISQPPPSGNVSLSDHATMNGRGVTQVEPVPLPPQSSDMNLSEPINDASHLDVVPPVFANELAGVQSTWEDCHQSQNSILAPLAEQEDGGTTSGGGSSWTSEATTPHAGMEPHAHFHEGTQSWSSHQPVADQLPTNSSPLLALSGDKAGGDQVADDPLLAPSGSQPDGTAKEKTEKPPNGVTPSGQLPIVGANPRTQPAMGVDVAGVPPDSLVNTKKRKAEDEEKPKNDGHNLLSNEQAQDVRGSEPMEHENENGLTAPKSPPDDELATTFQSVPSESLATDDFTTGSDSIQLLSSSSSNPGLETSGPLAESPKARSEVPAVGDTLQLYQELDDAFRSLDQEVNSLETGICS